MYVPTHFREDRRDVLFGTVRAAAFGTLVTLNEGRITASHIPFVLDEAEGPNGTLRGHLARTNPQWRSFDPTVEALVTFVVADAYVSPSWYPTKRETGKVVPTWNYIAVQAAGPLQVTQEPEALRRMLDNLTHQHEAPRPDPWAVTDAPAAFTTALLKAIVGVTIPITSLEGKWKLSQNRPDADRSGVLDGLRKDGSRAAGITTAMQDLADGKGAPPNKVGDV